MDALGLERARRHGEVRRLRVAGDVGVAGRVGRDAESLVVEAPPKIAEVEERAVRLDLRDEGVSAEWSRGGTRLEAARRRVEAAEAGAQVGGVGAPHHVGVAGRIHRDGHAPVAAAISVGVDRPGPADVGGIDQPGPGGIELHDEGVFAVDLDGEDVEGALRLERVHGGEVPRAGEAGHVGVPRPVDRDAHGDFAAGTAEIGRVDERTRRIQLGHIGVPAVAARHVCVAQRIHRDVVAKPVDAEVDRVGQHRIDDEGLPGVVGPQPEPHAVLLQDVAPGDLPPDAAHLLVDDRLAQAHRAHGGLQHEVALIVQGERGALERERDRPLVGPRGDHQVVLQLPLVTIEDQVDAGIQALVPDACEVGDAGPPLSRIPPHQVVALPGQLLDPGDPWLGIGADPSHAQRGRLSRSVVPRLTQLHHRPSWGQGKGVSDSSRKEPSAGAGLASRGFEAQGQMGVGVDHFPRGRLARGRHRRRPHQGHGYGGQRQDQLRDGDAGTSSL